MSRIPASLVPLFTRRTRRTHEAGVSLVEYAFIFILFMSLLLGISGFGHALFTYHHLNSAAKEATRYATVRGFSCNTTEVVSSCQASNSVSGLSGPTNLTDIQALVQAITPASIDYSKMTITACGVAGQSACTESSPQVCSAPVGTLPATPNYPGCTVKVTVSYPYKFIFPLVPTSTTVSAPCTTPGFCLSSTSEMIITH